MPRKKTEKPEKTPIHRITLASLALVVSAFVLLSLLSFDVADWPNPDVAPAAVRHNLCGRAGAFIAYYSLYYLGPATVPLLVAFAAWVVCRCMLRPVNQFVLRAIGVLLLAAALSAAWHTASPGSTNSLAIGNGGIVGIALGHFLVANAAPTGAALILAAAFLVGLILAADTLVIRTVVAVTHAAGHLRHHRSEPKSAPELPAGRFRRFRLPRLRWPRLRREHPDYLPRPATVPIPQREAAMREVAELDRLERAREEEELENAGASATETATEIKTSRSDREPPAAEVVAAVLARLRGSMPKPISAIDGDEETYDDYEFPPLELLQDPSRNYSAQQEKRVREKAAVLEATLHDFNINARVVEAETGPVITMFELMLAPGIKVAQISNLANDLARSLGAPAVRIVAPIPGKHTIGIEVPNTEKEVVRIKDLLHLAAARAQKMNIPLFLGKDASGEALCVDMTELPHVLIAGTTGSGKSVCLNTIIVSILLTQRPDMVKLILVDPKMVEMNTFRDLPHLMCPIVTEMKRAEQILEWLTVKMDERYALLAEARVRNIAGFNKLTPDEIYERFCPSNDEEKLKIPLRLPFIVVVIDELADLMMTSAKEVESYIIRLAQKSRAVGIHIILATQRPQATVVTGLIKSNLPSRISFRVAARMDSRIVLDQNGAETLLGQGDMLFLKPGTSELVRAQGAYISDAEINRIVDHVRETAKVHYHPELMQLNTMDPADMEKDELFDEAVKVVLQTGRGSVSLLQRRLTVGYSRASRLIDQMAMAGIVGEYKGSQAREVLITPEEYEEIKRHMGWDDDENGSPTSDSGAPAVGAGSHTAASTPPPTPPALTASKRETEEQDEDDSTLEQDPEPTDQYEEEDCEEQDTEEEEEEEEQDEDEELEEEEEEEEEEDDEEEYEDEDEDLTTGFAEGEEAEDDEEDDDEDEEKEEEEEEEEQ